MFNKRLSASLQAVFLFLIIGSPLVYNFTNQLFGTLLKTASNGCATCSGLVLHAIVFGLVSYLLMGIHSNTIYKNSTVNIISQDTGINGLNERPRNPPVTPVYLPAQLAAKMGPKTM
jgi:hypothetical protein